jgi:hypothetical protein
MATWYRSVRRRKPGSASTLCPLSKSRVSDVAIGRAIAGVDGSGGPVAGRNRLAVNCDALLCSLRYVLGPLTDGRLDVEIAVRICELFGPVVLGSDVQREYSCGPLRLSLRNKRIDSKGAHRQRTMRWDSRSHDVKPGNG